MLKSIRNTWFCTTKIMFTVKKSGINFFHSLSSTVKYTHAHTHLHKMCLVHTSAVLLVCRNVKSQVIRFSRAILTVSFWWIADFIVFYGKLPNDAFIQYRINSTSFIELIDRISNKSAEYSRWIAMATTIYDIKTQQIFIHLKGHNLCDKVNWI